MRADWGLRFYMVVALATLLGYAACETRGAVFASAEEKMPLPPDVRSTHGGYRTHSFWHVGYMGGK